MTVIRTSIKLHPQGDVMLFIQTRGSGQTFILSEDQLRTLLTQGLQVLSEIENPVRVLPEDVIWEE